ncbi:MAG: hypothetical protein ACXACX_20080 [Candidatus Hodarchaeales archaeon]|jgi:ribosomal protein L37AE/L43A
MSLDKEDLIGFLTESHSIGEIRQRYKSIYPNEVYLLLDELEEEGKIRYVDGRTEAKYQTTNNDFTGKIIEKIALLAGYHCCNPACRQFTSAPIENGIWLCITCHKKIDGPDQREYPPELLHKWKEEHSNWLRENLGVPFNLLMNQKLSLSFSKWKTYLKRDMKVIYKVKSFISRYEEIIKEYLENKNFTLKSLRIIGPRGVGKKTILIDVLERYFKDRLEKTLVFITENNDIIDLKFSDDMIIIIQECSNNFHEALYQKLDAFGYVNTVLITLGSDNYKAGIVKTHTKLVEIEEFENFQMDELLKNVFPSLTTPQSNKIMEMSGGIPAIAFDVYAYLKEEGITLDKIDQSWYHWQSRIDQYSIKESIPKEEILNLMQRFVLLGEIPYYDDQETRRQYLSYLKKGDIENVEIIMKSLIDYGFFKVQNFSLTLHPPFISLYLLKEISKDEIMSHLKALIKGEHKGFLSQFLKKIFMLKEEWIQNYVGWALLDELVSNWKSLSDPFYSTMVYHLSDFLPDQVMGIIEKLIQDTSIQQNSDQFSLIVKTLEKLNERSEFFFRTFNLLMKLALLEKTNKLIPQLSSLFLNGKVDFNPKLDYLRRKVDLNNENESYLIIELVCSLILPYSIEPSQIAQYYGPEGTQHKIGIDYSYLDSILNFLKLFLKSPHEKIKKHLFFILTKNVLTLLANGRWGWLESFFEEILQDFPYLKIKILNAIGYGNRLKNIVPADVFNQIFEWVEILEENFNIEEKIRWFFDINRQISAAKALKEEDIQIFAQKLIADEKSFKESLSYILKSDKTEIAGLGTTIANLDENFRLWPLIEENFIAKIENSSTNFVNGYTGVIFKKDASKWEEILTNFESIPNLEPKLYQLIIPKYPFKDHLDKLIELYKKGAFPKEKIGSLFITSQDRLKLLSPEECAKLIQFYFKNISNKLDGVNLFFLKGLLKAQEYVVPNEVENFIIEILTSFEDFDDFNAYLPELWNEIIEKIVDQNPNFEAKLIQTIFDKFDHIPTKILVDNIESYIEIWLQKDYEKTVDNLRKVMEIQDIKLHTLRYIFNDKIIKLISIKDQIGFCKEYPQFLGIIMNYHTSEFLTEGKITLFFENLIEIFPYDSNISKKTCLEIIRAKHKMDPASIKEFFNNFDKLIGETSNEALKNWLKEVIECLKKKIG